MPPAVRHDRPATAVPPAVQVFTLGGFRVLVNGQPLDEHAWRRTSARQLFKCLLSLSSRRMTRDEVTELLWPDSDPDAASSNLRSTIHALRRALEPSAEDSPATREGASATAGGSTATPDGPSGIGTRDRAAGVGVIFGDRASVWLRPDVELWLDADAFDLTLAQARQAADPLPLLEHASALYAGHYLPDDLHANWATERRESLKHAWAELQFRLAHELEQRGDPDAAVHALQRLLQVDPSDERAAQAAMQLLSRHGRRSEALRVYQHVVQALADELGVEPSEDTQALQRHIAAGEPAPEPSVATSFRCAYPFPAPTELISRDAELALLDRVLARRATGGQAALVGAPAGTGKSALAGELVKRAQAQGVLCLAGGCYEQRGAVPFGPFHDALVDYLLAQPVDRVRADLGSSADDLARVIPELRYQLNLAEQPAREPPQADRMRVFGAIHACLRTLAERRSTLLCLEDLHAADEATLQLFHYLLRQTRRLPLVLIGTYRSDEAPAGQPLAQMLTAIARERLAEHVRLPALDRPGTNSLAALLLGDAPSDPLTDSLFSATGGNPLFVEQLVLALSEGGQLQRRDGRWHGRTDLQATPAIVGEVITQRLLRLTSTCRDALAVASVVGQAVDHQVLLAAVEPLEESTLLVDLDQAIGASVLQEMPGGYAFRHALMRDAVYWSLSSPRRMLLHGRVGEVLERLHGDRADDYAAELAHHFMLGGESELLRGKALHYSMVAGRRAAELSSFPQALEHFSSAWELIDRDGSLADLDTLLEVLRGRGRAEAETARYPETVESCRRLLSYATDPVQRARAYGLMAWSLGHSGEFRQLLEACHAGLAELVDLAGPEATDERIHLRQMIALAWYLQGRYRELVRLGQLMETEAVGPGSRMQAHLVIGWGHMGQGQVDQALEEYELALAAARDDPRKIPQATCHTNLGLQNYLGGRFAAAREHLGRALAVYNDAATDLRAVNALQTLCRVWIAEGEHVRASERVLQALDLEIQGHERWAADAHHILGVTQVLRADWDAAAASFRQALRVRTQAGDMAGMVESTVALGLVDQCLGRWKAAAAKYADAVMIADGMDPSPPRVAARRALGRLRLLTGDLPAAADELEAALAIAETMPDTLEYAPTLLAMAELRLHQAELDAAQPGEGQLNHPRLEEALQFAAQALEHARPLEQQADAHALLAQLHLALGHDLEASKHATEALALADRLASPRLKCRAQLVLALSAATQSSHRASAHFESALKHADETHMTHERARVLSAYADHLRATASDTDAAASMEAQALEIADNLGLQRFTPTSIHRRLEVRP